jgi:hypothetical protein
MIDSSTSKKTKIKWWMSWPVIIIAWIIFWPVGAVLSWRRVSVDRKAMMLSSKFLIIAGWIGIAIAVLGIFVSFSEGFGSDDITVILFLLFAGGALLFLGKKVEKTSAIYKKYITIVANQGVTSLASIANIMNVSLENTKKDIETMINKGFFPNTYINEVTQEIVIASSQQNSDIPQSHNKNMKVVTCQGCGANNSIPEGEVGECEFCGSILK